MTAPALILSLRLLPGASSDEVERLVAKVLKPTLSALDDAPAVRAGLVLGGESLQALESEAPNELDAIRERAADGRLEVLALPIYKPHLDDVPEEDALGQVAAHVSLLRRMLNVRPRGLYLPWDTYSGGVPRVAEAAGLDWVALPNAQGVFSVESSGTIVRALGFRRLEPGDARLVDGEAGFVDLGRLPARDTLEADDWPWFQELLGGLSSTRLPSEVVDQGLPAGRRIWGATARAAEYRQRWGAADVLHQRVMATSKLVGRFSRDETEVAGPDPVDVVQAQRYLWRAQAGDLFEDGEGGGIRAPAQRHRAWRDVLRAERVALEGLRIARRPSATRVDLDGDGLDEIMLRSTDASARVIPARRGGLASWSISGSALQLGAVPRRTRSEWEATLRPDPTSAPAVPQEGEGTRPEQLYALLREDVEPRLSFGERFLHASASLDRFEEGLLDGHSTGLDDPWEVESAERSGRGARTSLVGRGELHDEDSAWPVEIRKRYALRGTELELLYEVQNRGLGVLRTRVLLPLDLSLGPDVSSHQVVYKGVRHAATELGDDADITSIRVVGAAGEVSIRTDSGVRLWRYPIHTVHHLQGRPAAALQGVCLGLVWLLQLWGRETASLSIRVSFAPT